jgi:hypothetical protein
VVEDECWTRVLGNLTSRLSMSDNPRRIAIRGIVTLMRPFSDEVSNELFEKPVVNHSQLAAFIKHYHEASFCSREIPF